MKRGDIQALRGFSVLAVLLYHLQVRSVKGGFLGVDIFFVISGYVITERLARGDGSMRDQILDFYRRRAKRILPASLFVILVTAIVARVFLSPLSWARFGWDGLATTLFAGNIRFAAQGNNYLAGSLSPTPYLHYWSLGVEEQFYLLWPILFLFFFRARTRLIIPFAFAATIFAFWFTRHAPVDSFYQPFSRAWEFLVGIIAVLIIPKPRRGSKAIAISGWVLIVLSIFVIGSDLPVPGITTLVPVFAAAAILVARQSVPWERLLVWMGDHSFAIYLIHWPLIVIALSRYQGLSMTVKVAIFMISILGGFAISNFIERPFRFNQRFSLGFRAWGTGLALVSAATFSLTTFASATPVSKKFTIDLSEPVVYSDKCHLDFGISKPVGPCLFGHLASKKLVVLVGDSHAAQWFNAVESTAIKSHWKLLSLTKSSCPGAFLLTKRHGVVDQSCAQWQRYVADRIKTLQPTKVFITSFSEYEYPLVTSGEYSSRYASGERDFINSLGLPANSVYYIEDTPRPPASIPDCLAKHASNIATCDFPLQRSAATTTTKLELSKIGIHYLEFNSVLCPKNACQAVFAGANTYRDASHLSVSTSKNLASQFAQKVSP